jgi:Uma2 family endonuclease
MESISAMIDLAPEKVRVTSAAFRQLPQTNRIQELIDGEIIVTSPLDAHQAVSWVITLFLGVLLQGRGIFRYAPTGLHLEEGHDYEPDIFWISPANTGCILDAEGRYWHGAPDLIVEILSPTTTERDHVKKYEMYEKHGVREYWIIDPAEQFVLVYRHNGTRYDRVGGFVPGAQFTSAALGADIPVASLFPPEQS